MEYLNILENYKTDYLNLIEEFLKISKPHIGFSVLDDLKCYYSNVIRSVRQSDYINNLDGLVRVLEKRDALSYVNIEPLKYISATYVRDPVLDRLLRNYEERMSDRPPIPLFNAYDVPSGKYIIEKRCRDTWRVSLKSTNTVVLHRKNYKQQMSERQTNCNNASESPIRIYSSSEDILHDETENFLQNNPSILSARREYDINELTTPIAKACNKISSYGVTVIFTFAGAAVIIFLITMSNVKQSVPSYEDHTRVAIPPTSSSGSRRHQIRAQMIFYTTPQPAFHLALSGSIQNGPFDQSSDENFEQTQRMVLLEISEKLGRHWRDVARLLGVTEYDIDEINYNLEMPLKEKAFKALLKIQSKCDALQWRSKLQRALERARRRDLVELVDELYTRKHG